MQNTYILDNSGDYEVSEREGLILTSPSDSDFITYGGLSEALQYLGIIRKILADYEGSHYIEEDLNNIEDYIIRLTRDSDSDVFDNDLEEDESEDY